MNLNVANISFDLFQDICRLCLKKLPSEHTRYLIFGTSIEDHSLEEILTKCFHIEVNEDDNLPQHLCVNCTFSLGQIYNFYELCHKSQKTLINVLEKENSKEDSKLTLEEAKSSELESVFIPESTICDITENDIKEEANVIVQVEEYDEKPEKNENINISSQKRSRKRNNLGLLLECKKCDAIFPTHYQYQKHKRLHEALENRENIQNTDQTLHNLVKGENNEELDASSQNDSETSRDTKTIYRQIYNSIKRDKKGQPLECKRCNVIFPNNNQYRKHRVVHRYLNKTEREADNTETEAAGEEDNSQIPPNRPLKRDNAGRIIECGKCNVVFPNNHKLRLHRMTHERPFECPLCHEKFTRITGLNRHLEVHSGNRLKRDKDGRQRECEICHKICSSYMTYRVHKFEHSGGQKPYVCPHCGQDFLMYSRLKKHLGSHTDERPFQCPLCSKWFKRKIYVSYHIRNVHTVQPPTEVKCTKCDKVFDSEKKMKTHSRLKHYMKPFLCAICGTYLARRAQWMMHMRTHTGEKPFKCEYCDRAFVTKFLLRYHTNLHTGEKPYQCNMCGEAFASPRRLQVHKKKIHNTDLHKCTFCNREFLQRTNLMKHIETHKSADLLDRPEKVQEKLDDDTIYQYVQDVYTNSEESS